MARSEGKTSSSSTALEKEAGEMDLNELVGLEAEACSDIEGELTE